MSLEEGLTKLVRGVRVAVHLPCGCFVVVYDEARHRWKHAIHRHVIHERRVCRQGSIYLWSWSGTRAQRPINNKKKEMCAVILAELQWSSMDISYLSLNTCPYLKSGLLLRGGTRTKDHPGMAITCEERTGPNGRSLYQQCGHGPRAQIPGGPQ
ncbi:hypothetical protein J4Q44_G00072660 [Coregonus suidteri]|uniref:Leucine-rich repeat and WD repeat-containing protein 1 WD domain-containing protein n=1 Tax=Coregonus suidteri TaxID=861788 RepID=A0AAN8R356_9TELE